MIAERTLAQAAHAWGAQGIPFNDEPKNELFRTASMEHATTLLNQSVALRSVMLLSGGNGVGKSTLVGRWVRQLETRLYTPVNLTQATLSSSGLLATLSRSLGKRASFRRERNLDELSAYGVDRNELIAAFDKLPANAQAMYMRVLWQNPSMGILDVLDKVERQLTLSESAEAERVLKELVRR